MIYVYVAAFDLSGEEKYRQAAQNAADFIILNMSRQDGLGWYKAVNEKGKAVNQSVHSYGYSAAIFALAHVYRITGDNRYLKNALDTWQSGAWRGLDAAREFHANGAIPDVDVKKAWSQNPYMHLFEALLMLQEVSQSQQVLSDITAMAQFLRERLIQPCECLPEWFNAPGVGPHSDLYLGHQIEWAFLLSQAVDQGLDPSYLAVANGLLDYALRYGLDRQSGGLRAESKVTGEISNSAYWWWAQAELMRAAVHFARNHGRTELWDIYQDAHLFARIHYINQDIGGWASKSLIQADSSIQNVKQAIGYHAMAFYVEALTEN